MKRIRISAAAVLLLGALAQSTGTAVAQNGDTPPVIDPDAVSALKDMGKYLMTLNIFQIKAEITREKVLTDGQKVQHSADVDLVASRPGKLRVNVTSDRETRQFFYDGKSFTLYAPILKHYATVPAPASIKDLAVQLEDKYDIELPLVDLFRWGTDDNDASEITAAKSLGVAQIDGTTVEHFAFRQNGLDWQVWIQAGDYPLPRKIVLTTTTDDARPQMSAKYSWNLAPAFNDEAFAFTPPAGVTKITLAEVKPIAGAARK